MDPALSLEVQVASISHRAFYQLMDIDGTSVYLDFATVNHALVAGKPPWYQTLGARGVLMSPRHARMMSACLRHVVGTCTLQGHADMVPPVGCRVGPFIYNLWVPEHPGPHIVGTDVW